MEGCGGLWRGCGGAVEGAFWGGFGGGGPGADLGAVWVGLGGFGAFFGGIGVGVSTYV